MTPTIAKAAYVLMAALWYVLRIPHERKARKTPIARDALDARERLRLTVSLTGLGIVPMIYVATGWPAFAARSFSPLAAWLGVVLAVAALVVFRLTHKALGRYWSVSLQMRKEHKLITEGIYSRIRHPMYSAFWLWALAQALLLPNWIAGLSGIIGFGTLYLLRVGPEERMLLDTFGDEYRAYMARTGRLLPKLF
ncbi:MAG TPA: protein-S-isoprenylcysteine O-methyltransferase [Beijerinckiaceae bacterium]|nr:protein-S-isoprenylcysteine O-methyltransferase [Beijerinckiaceae bacterium]